MLERVTYINHLNEVIDFGRNGIFVKSSDLHDYGWTVVQKNDKISGFKRGVKKRTLPVTIFASTPEAGIAARNRLMEVAEKDVLANKPGKLIIGEYYYRCYITASVKTSYLRTRRLMELKLTLHSDKDYWVRETSHIFRKTGAGRDQTYDYLFDYAYDYMPGTQRSTLTNTGFVASNFRMIIYGACLNPVVYIGGHAYGVNCRLNAGEYLTIDSAAKTVIKTAVDGTIFNQFNARLRKSYVFEPIPPGTNAVMWDGDFGIDIVLLEERSEPKWT